MKKHTILILLLFLIIGFNKAWAQTILSAGDVAITSFNADTNDEISFILLKDITANTKIYLTENGWDDDANGGGAAPTWGNTNQGTLEWTSSSAMRVGAQIQVTTPKLNATLKVSEGTIIKYGTWSTLASSDSIIIYQGTAKPDDGTEVTQFIWAFNTGANDWVSDATGSNKTTGIPTGLIDGTNAISFKGVTEDDNLQYNCNVTSVNDITALRTSLATESNYNTNNTNANYKAPICITTTWNGATDSSWSNTANWSDAVPSYGFNVTIPDLAKAPVIGSNTAASVGNLTITETEGLTINSGGTLIVSGTSSGNVTYKRNLATTNWYSVSPPVSGEIMTDMRANNDFAPGTSGGRIGFAPYDNSQADPNNRWAYFTTSSNDLLINGKGYTAKLATTGNISYTGTINDTDVSIGLTQGGVNGNNYNLLGNPYTAFINSGFFLKSNTAELVQEEIYIWNQASSQYDTKVSGISFKVAPGQGFFVEANSTNNVTFTKAIQSHETIGTFQKTANTTIPKITLYMSDNTSSRYTDIYYINMTTTGFDNGYDGKLFGGFPQPFALYTHLISDSKGDNFQIQSLPNSNHENMMIPIGINADGGKKITFTAHASSLPSKIKVYLEDRLTHTFTRLDVANNNYKITLSEPMNGIGRFYLHTTESVLNIDTNYLENVSIYKKDNSTLRVVGLSQKRSKLKLFNILGKQMLNASFTSNKVQDISLPKLTKGIYFVRLETDNGYLNKKIILE
ncbi:T9SS type A sorting domain-containing protein [uncultured Polaribacter sp.]|uniref:T9SS type A sorting domain-containing protein n=1 Tax=uncultured Polaribacter sp. TaxID=174711 RepID=UPI002636DFC4|nr:T9SS type A sorting domain-containing protein [uncultured Polaribacter sp.]